jgi:hypothetical protein
MHFAFGGERGCKIASPLSSIAFGCAQERTHWGGGRRARREDSACLPTPVMSRSAVRKRGGRGSNQIAGGGGGSGSWGPQ